MKLIEHIRKYLKEEKIDYLLVNSTNEFLVEYPELAENSRYHLTKFTGSTGDALISQKEIFLFVDSRYHEQADTEVDKSKVKVVKMPLGIPFPAALTEKINKNSTVVIISKKIRKVDLRFWVNISS